MAASARPRRPRNMEEAGKMAAEMRKLKEGKRLVEATHNPLLADLKKLLERARGRRDRALKRLQVKYDRMEELMKQFARINRDNLITGRTKSVAIPGGGTFRFRNQDDKLVFDLPEEEVARRLKDELGHPELVIIKVLPWKEGLELKQDREQMAELGKKAGFHFESVPENIFVDPGEDN